MRLEQVLQNRCGHTSFERYHERCAERARQIVNAILAGDTPATCEDLEPPPPGYDEWLRAKHTGQVTHALATLRRILDQTQPTAQ